MTTIGKVFVLCRYLGTNSVLRITKRCLSDNDFYQIVPLRLPHRDGAWTVMRDIFFRDDDTSRVLKLHECTAAKDELRKFFDWVVSDNVSYAAVDKRNEEVVTIELCKLWVPDDIKYLEQYKENCRFSPSRGFIQQFLEVNVFDYCKVDCVFESMVVASVDRVRGQGLAQKLMLITHNLGREMAKQNAKDANENNKIPKGYFTVNTAVTKHIVQKFSPMKHSEDIEKEMVVDGQKKILRINLTYEVYDTDILT